MYIPGFKNFCGTTVPVLEFDEDFPKLLGDKSEVEWRLEITWSSLDFWTVKSVKEVDLAFDDLLGDDFSEFEAFFLSLRLIGEPPLSGEVSDLDFDLMNTVLAL